MSVAPPKWAKRVKFTSADGKTDPGAKLLWLTLWSYAPLERAKDDEGSNREPVSVWPTRKTIAEELGESLETVKGWLKRVAAAGWVRRAGSRWELAVCVPFAEGGEYQPPGGERSPGLVLTRGEGEYQPGEGLYQPGEGEHQPPEVEKKQNLSRSGSRKQRARDPIDRELDALIDSDSRQAAHAAIVAQQAKLEAARSQTRAELAAKPKLSPPYIAAVRAAGYAWSMELERGPIGGRTSWADSLLEAVIELALSTEQVTAVLVAWDAQTEALGGALVAGASQGKGKSMPTRAAVWWATWRPWLRSVLGVEAPVERAPDKAGLGCSWPSNTPRTIRRDYASMGSKGIA